MKFITTEVSYSFIKLEDQIQDLTYLVNEDVYRPEDSVSCWVLTGGVRGMIKVDNPLSVDISQ